MGRRLNTGEILGLYDPMIGHEEKDEENPMTEAEAQLWHIAQEENHAKSLCDVPLDYGVVRFSKRPNAGKMKNRYCFDCENEHIKRIITDLTEQLKMI